MSCNNPNAPFNVRIVFPEKSADEESTTGSDIEVRGVSPIKVRKQIEGTKTVYIVSYSPSIGPSCGISVTPSVIELGVQVQLTFSTSATKGSSDIATQTITPNDLVNNRITVTPLQAGNQYLHTFNIVDEEGQTCSSAASVNVKYRFYKGTIARNNDTLDVATITSFTSNLGSSIGEAFGRQEYTMDQVEGHYLWVYPADFPSIPTPTGAGNFPFQITVLPGTWTINGIAYKAAKTSTYFKSGGKATLGF